MRRVFGGGKPDATSDALMVAARNAARPAAAVGEKSKLSVALARAKAPPPETTKVATKASRSAGEQLALDKPLSATESEPIGEKKAAKKRAGSRKRKVAAATADAVADSDGDEVVREGVARPPMAQPQTPEADVWVSDAVVWSLSGRWSSNADMWSPPPGAEGPKRLEEFLEKAAEGKLIIWGRAGDVGVWEPIEAQYWKSCGIEQFSFLEGREKVFTEPKTAAKPKPGKSGAAAKYTALKVNRAQVEEVWRSGTMH